MSVFTWLKFKLRMRNEICNPITSSILNILRTYKIDQVNLNLCCLETLLVVLLKFPCFWQSCLSAADLHVSFILHLIIYLVNKYIWIHWLFTFLFWYSRWIERKQVSCLRHWRHYRRDGGRAIKVAAMKANRKWYFWCRESVFKSKSGMERRCGENKWCFWIREGRRPWRIVDKNLHRFWLLSWIFHPPLPLCLKICLL